MTILYVTAGLAIHGGIERVLVDRVNWLAEHGDDEIWLLTVNQFDHPLVFQLNPRVRLYDLGIGFHRRYRYSGLKRLYEDYKLHKLFRQRLSDEIKKISPHVISFTQLDFVYDITKVCGNIPVIYESHSSCLFYKLAKTSRLQKLQCRLWIFMMRRVQTVVTMTQGDAKEWERFVSNVKVIPNIVHQNETGRVSDCHSRSVIFVGRYSYQKDIGMLLRIWELVHQRYPEWQLHLYGDYGDEQETLLPNIKRLNINVVVHEPTPTIYDEYLNSSILLLTSRFEPFGLVLPEAMSCGLPVVAYDCPYGPADIITDGEDGFLVRDRNMEDYVEKVCLLMGNEKLRLQMGAKGICSSMRYNASNIMPQWILLYEQLSNINNAFL